LVEKELEGSLENVGHPRYGFVVAT